MNDKLATITKARDTRDRSLRIINTVEEEAITAARDTARELRAEANTTYQEVVRAILAMGRKEVAS
jgi:hypothetical protein